MVTTAPVTPGRSETAARWAAALDRADTHGITVRQDPITGVFTAPSSDHARHYVVSWYGCECAAAQGGDPVCLHRAAYRNHCQEEDRAVARQLREAIEAEPVFPVMPAHLAELYVTADEDGEPQSSDLLEPIEPDHRMCTDCLDTGWARMYLSSGLYDYTEVRCGCTQPASAAA